MRHILDHHALSLRLRTRCEDHLWYGHALSTRRYIIPVDVNLVLKLLEEPLSPILVTVFVILIVSCMPPCTVPILKTSSRKKIAIAIIVKFFIWFVIVIVYSLN